MKTKTDKPKSKDEEQFYQFAKALMAVPKKELDRELAKHEKVKDKQSSRSRSRQRGNR